MVIKIADALLPNLVTCSVCFTAVAPFVVLCAGLWLDSKRRWENEKPPQSEKLLRPAGYSLEVRLNTASEELPEDLLILLLVSLLAGTAAVFTANFLGKTGMTTWAWVSGGVALLLALLTIFLVIRLLRRRLKIQNWRLGLRGEQAVAETLQELGDCGYRAFNDLEGGANWNIDHIAVGPKGVFAIETKARRKRRSLKDQPSHVVTVDGTVLRFPTGKDAKAIPQAQRNARWLADFLSKKTGENVEVTPLVVVPGWFVQGLSDGQPLNVMNAKYLAGYLRRQNDKIPPAQLRRIIAALDEKCRTLEF